MSWPDTDADILSPGCCYQAIGLKFRHLSILGAYFADDFEALLKQAHLSALITHSHPEGIAGAIAVALAAALAWRSRCFPMSPQQFLDEICERRRRVQSASALARPAISRTTRPRKKPFRF